MYARAYVRIWTLRSWYNNSSSQWRVKVEMRPFYRKKFKFWKTWRSNLVCHGTFLGGFTKGQINITEEKLLSLVVIAWTVLKLFNFLTRVPQKLFPPPRGRLNRINNKVNLYHHGNQLLIFPGTENRLGYVSRNNERKRREIIYIRQLLYCNLITVKSSYFVVCSRMADLLGVKKILWKSYALTSFLSV